MIAKARLFQFIFQLVLSFALIWTPIPQAHAQTKGLLAPNPLLIDEDLEQIRARFQMDREANFDGVVSYAERSNQLYDAFNGDLSDNPLDQFRLLRQLSINPAEVARDNARKALLEENHKEVLRREIDWLTAELDNNYVDFRHLLTKQKRNDDGKISHVEDLLVNAAALLGHRSVNPDIARQVLEAARTDIKIAEALGIEKEVVEDFLPDDVPLQKNYRLTGLSMQVVRADEDPNLDTVAGKNLVVVDQMRFKDFVGSGDVGFTQSLFAKSSYNSLEGNRVSVQILNGKNQVVHLFNEDVVAAGFFGRFLVYVEALGFNSESGATQIRFVDLGRFRGSIGNAHLPVYSLPVKIGSEGVQSFDIVDGRLIINGVSVEHGAFEAMSEFQTIVFNIAVGLVDPKRYLASKKLIKEIHEFASAMVESGGDLMTALANSATLSPQDLKDMSVDVSKNLELSTLDPEEKKLMEKAKEDALKKDPLLKDNRVFKHYDEQSRIGELMLQTNRAQQVSRRLMGRYHMMIASLLHPQPDGAGKLMQAMAVVSEGLRSKDRARTDQGIQSLKRHPLARYAAYGTGVLAAAALGQTVGTHLPEAYAFDLYRGLDLVEAVFGAGKSYLEHIDYGANFVRLFAQDATEKVYVDATTGLSEAYIENGRAPKLMVLVTALVLTPLLAFSAVHSTVGVVKNSAHLISRRSRIYVGGKSKIAEMKEQLVQEGKSPGLLQRIGAYLSAASDEFRKHQTRQREMVLKNWAASEHKGSGIHTDLTPEQEKVAQRFVKDTFKQAKPEAAQKKRSFFSFFKSRKAAQILEDETAVDKAVEGHSEVVHDKLHSENEIQAEVEASKGPLKNMLSFQGALKQAFLSYSSQVATRHALGTIWGYLFLVRSFWIAPKTWYMAVMFPNYFRTTISARPGNVMHVPTVFNGGKKRVWTASYHGLKSLFGSQSLKNLRKFEKAILPVEFLAHDIALEKATEALIKFDKDPKALAALFNSMEVKVPGFFPNSMVTGGASPSVGISKLSDPKVAKLKATQRYFFRAYFTQLMDSLMKAYVTEAITQKDIVLTGDESLNELKDLASRLPEGDLGYDPKNPETFKEVRRWLEAKASSPELERDIYQKSESIAKDYPKFLERMSLNFDHKLVTILDPMANPQARRFKTAEDKMKDFKSMLRATRAENMSLFVSAPLSAITSLLFYAGIQDGSLYQPLHDEMFGPNSWFYGSRALFLNGFVMSIMLSIVASSWMKVQEDHRIDTLGGFNKVPLVKDQDKGFWRYYFKNFYKNPTNKWADQQLYNAGLIWANIPAALITNIVFNAISLGRFDLGLFLATYIIIFLTPLMGFGQKIEQAFELATSWVEAKVKRRLRPSVAALEAVNKVKQRQRFFFNIYDFSFSFALAPISIGEVMDTPRFGNRSFLNLFFGGLQPEEWVSKGLQGAIKLTDGTSIGPAVEVFATKCELLLTNNNVALDPTKLISNPDPSLRN